MTPVLRCLVVDDEALARQRMARLLTEVQTPRCEVVASAGDAVEAMSALQQHAVDVLFLDVHMPGLDGVAFARKLKELPSVVPQIVFVTAHMEYAVDAFALHAADYLTKPVKAQRLQDCVARLLTLPAPGASSSNAATTVLIQDPRKSYRLDLQDVLLLRAELKYVSAITLSEGQLQTHVLSQSLAEIEQTWPELFVRTHRQTLVKRRALMGLVRGAPADDEEVGGDTWLAQVRDLTDTVAVSRRQLPAVRQVLRDLGR
jgi:two-component system, LytTR family, response regulator AlgR